MSTAAPGANQYIFDSRASAAKRNAILTRDTDSDRWAVLQGTSVPLTEAYDTSPHVFTAQLNGDATTKLTVSGVGSATGDAGAQIWDFATLFAASDGSGTMPGYIARVLVYDFPLGDASAAKIANYLKIYHRTT